MLIPNLLNTFDSLNYSCFTVVLLVNQEEEEPVLTTEKLTYKAIEIFNHDRLHWDTRIKRT